MSGLDIDIDIYYFKGEGLKIGTLALLRNNHEVQLATHNCSWRFSLERHPHFDETVLTVNVEGNLISYHYVHVGALPL